MPSSSYDEFGISAKGIRIEFVLSNPSRRLLIKRKMPQKIDVQRPNLTPRRDPLPPNHRRKMRLLHQMRGDFAIDEIIGECDGVLDDEMVVVNGNIFSLCLLD